MDSVVIIAKQLMTQVVNILAPLNMRLAPLIEQYTWPALAISFLCMLIFVTVFRAVPSAFVKMLIFPIAAASSYILVVTSAKVFYVLIPLIEQRLSTLF